MGCERWGNEDILFVANDPVSNELAVITRPQIIYSNTVKLNTGLFSYPPPNYSPYKVRRFDLTTNKFSAPIASYPYLDLHGSSVNDTSNHLLTYEQSTLVAIDLASGERTILSAAQPDLGPIFTPVSVVYNALTDSAIAISDGGGITTYSIDLATGVRTLIANFELIGVQITDVALDTQGGNLYFSFEVGASAEQMPKHVGVVRLDLNTRTHTVLLDSHAGTGPFDLLALPARMNGVVYYAAQDALIISVGEQIIKMELATGVSQLLATISVKTKLGSVSPRLTLAADALIVRVSPSETHGVHYLYAYDLLTNEFEPLEPGREQRTNQVILANDLFTVTAGISAMAVVFMIAILNAIGTILTIAG